MLEILRDKAKRLPMLPGVYIMLDEQSQVIYVGKAKKLKNRVSSYFHGEHIPKVAAMVGKVHDFNVIVAGSEFEALVLENSLIKRHKPRYNILLKDDKGYPFIRVDVREEYPAMKLVSRTVSDGAKYFGPFGGRAQTREIISTLSKTLLLPDCARKFPRDIGKSRPCLNYHMGVCAGWCQGRLERDEYRRRMEQAMLILEGKSEQLKAQLTKEHLAKSINKFGGLVNNPVLRIVPNFIKLPVLRKMQKKSHAGVTTIFTNYGACELPGELGEAVEKLQFVNGDTRMYGLAVTCSCIGYGDTLSLCFSRANRDSSWYDACIDVLEEQNVEISVDRIEGKAREKHYSEDFREGFSFEKIKAYFNL